MKRFLAVFVAFAVATVPVTASALVPSPPVSLTYDDGSFELPPFTLNAVTAPVVQFEFPPAPGAGVYSLDRVWFSLQEQTPSDPAPASLPVTVQIWEQQTDPVLGPVWVQMDPIVENVSADDTGMMPGWYYLDLEGLNFAQTVRVGIFHDEASQVLDLGIDSNSTVSGRSLLYDPVTASPDAPWPMPYPAGNYGIRATVHFVPAMTCQGFLPPLDRTISMKWGGRNIPLKAFLADDAGLPLTSESLATPPVVALYLVDSTGAILEDKTSDVAAPGRSNNEQSFRNTYGGKWRYNLKTKKSFEAGTYMVQFVSGDSGEYVIDPACTGTFVVTQGPKTKKAPKGKNK